MALPSAGAVQPYQIETWAGFPAWSGSPTSFVASLFSPSTLATRPVSSCAAANASFAGGAASAAAGTASAAATTSRSPSGLSWNMTSSSWELAGSLGGSEGVRGASGARSPERGRTRRPRGSAALPRRASSDRPRDEQVGVAAPARRGTASAEEPRPHAPAARGGRSARDGRPEARADDAVELPAGERVEAVDLELDQAATRCGPNGARDRDGRSGRHFGGRRA